MPRKSYVAIHYSFIILSSVLIECSSGQDIQTNNEKQAMPEIFSQNKDTRAELYIRGEIKDITATPTGKIWLTTVPGEIYYAESINSNWHYASSLFKAGVPMFGIIRYFEPIRHICPGVIKHEFTRTVPLDVQRGRRNQLIMRPNR